MITLASSSWTDRKGLEILLSSTDSPCVYLWSPGVTTHDKISQALPLWVSEIHFNHHGGPGKLLQTTLRTGKVLKCHFNQSNTRGSEGLDMLRSRVVDVEMTVKSKHVTTNMSNTYSSFGHSVIVVAFEVLFQQVSSWILRHSSALGGNVGAII